MEDNYMYQYTWYQWLFIFYLYCFLGWIFESSYVSLKERRPVNRGFLRLPLLPLYGTGAVMMLWVSLPLREHLLLVFLAGMTASTALEYITGWCMEQLFRIRYWDYSSQAFNLHGYICLSSSIAWGVLTLLLTEVIHKPVEFWIVNTSQALLLLWVLFISVFFILDTVQSVQAALNLAKVLDSMTHMLAELEDIQVQLALLKAETNQKLANIQEEASHKLAAAKAEAALYRTSKEEQIRSLTRRMSELAHQRQHMALHIDLYQRGILKRNPGARSTRFETAFKELREIAEKQLHK